MIIAIIIAVLFNLGVFNSPNITTTCLAQTGFLCTSPIITSTGAVYAQFSQNTGAPITITGFGCSNTTAAPLGFNQTLIQLQPGQQINAMFPCPVSSGNIGTHFTGTLWISYYTPAASGLIEQVGSIDGSVSTYQYLYVLNQYSSTVAVINMKTNQVANIINLPNGYNPSQIIFSPDGQYAYISVGNVVYGSNSMIDVVSTDNFQVVTSIPLPNPNPSGIASIAFSPDGQYIYAISSDGIFDSGSILYKINAKTYSIINSITIGFAPDYMEFSPNGEYLYISEFCTLYGLGYGCPIGNPSAVQIINVNQFSLENTITLNPTDATINFGQNNNNLYTVNQGTDTISVIDTQSFQVLNTINVGPKPLNITFSPNGQYAYVINSCTNCGVSTSSSVSVINLNNFQVTKTIYTGLTNGAASMSFVISPNGQYAYIPNLYWNTVSVVDMATSNVVNAINVGSGPDYVVFSPNGKYAYVTDNYGADVSVIDTATDMMVARINTEYGDPSVEAIAPE